MNCPNCNRVNRDGAKFCVQCGHHFSDTCAACAAPLPPSARFCDECGSPVTNANARASPECAPSSYTPKHLVERKTITALFADIKGSMELMEDLDPEEARGIIDPALQLMMDAVHRYEGYGTRDRADRFR